MRAPTQRPILITDPVNGERQVILYTATELLDRFTPDQRDTLFAGTTIQSGPIFYTDLLASHDAVIDGIIRDRAARNRWALATADIARDPAMGGVL